MKMDWVFGEGISGCPSGGGPASGASLIVMVSWLVYVGISMVCT